MPRPNHSSRFKDLFFRLTEHFVLLWFRECFRVIFLPVLILIFLLVHYMSCNLRHPERRFFLWARDMTGSTIRGNASYFYLIWHVINEDESYLIKEFYYSSPPSSLYTYLRDYPVQTAGEFPTVLITI